MVITEFIEDKFVRHYSNLNVKVIQNETGAVYDEVVDIVPSKFTYSETNEPIEDILDAQSALDMIFGGTT